MTQVCVYGKQDCGKCEAAKDKLQRMGYAYRFIDLEEFPENWRETNTVHAMAEYQFSDTLPIVEIEGDMYSYQGAMKALKAKLREVKRELVCA